MAIQKEVWVRDIQDVLFQTNNEFLRESVNHDEFVSDKTVHIPQSGSLAAATKNRSVFPATIEERTDTDLTYDLDDFSTDPVRIGNIDEIQTSYLKRRSVMLHHNNILRDIIAIEGIFNWATNLGANQVRTSGSTSSINLPPSGTGSRKKLVVQDLANIARIFDNQNMPEAGRFVMLPTSMYYEVFTITDLIKADIIGELTLPEAALKKVLGLNIIKRSDAQTVIYDNAGTPQKKAIGAAGAATDNFGGIAWHRDFVATALGAINVFEETGSPTLYGDVLSSQVLTKSVKLRTNEAGIITLVQST